MKKPSDRTLVQQAIDILETAEKGVTRDSISLTDFYRAMNILGWQTALVRQRKRPTHPGETVFAFYRRQDGTTAAYELFYTDGWVSCNARAPHIESEISSRPPFISLVEGVVGCGPQKPVNVTQKYVMGDHPFRIIAESLGVNPSFKI